MSFRECAKMFALVNVLNIRICMGTTSRSLDQTYLVQVDVLLYRVSFLG